jgi:hypothetical protein
MAFCVIINKLSDNEKFFFYEYGSTDKKLGKIKICKKTGDTFLIENAEDDATGSKAKRTSWKLMRHWKNVEYPDKTFWAS